MPKYQLVGANVAEINGTRVEKGGSITLTRAQYAALPAGQQNMLDLIDEDVASETPRTALGYAKYTVNNAAAALTAIPNGAIAFDATVDGGDIAWRDDGTNPTAADGKPLWDRQTMWYQASPLSGIKFIRRGAVNVTLHVTFYGI